MKSKLRQNHATLFSALQRDSFRKHLSSLHMKRSQCCSFLPRFFLMHHCGLLTHLWMEDRLHDEHRRRHVAAALSTHSHSVSHYSQTALLLHYQNTVSLQTSFYFNSSTSFSSVITAVLYILAGYITWSLIHFRRCSTASCQCHVTRLAGLFSSRWVIYSLHPPPHAEFYFIPFVFLYFEVDFR